MVALRAFLCPLTAVFHVSRLGLIQPTQNAFWRTDLSHNRSKEIGRGWNCSRSVLDPRMVPSRMLLAVDIVLWVKRLARGWTRRRSNSGGGENFRISPDRFWGPPSFLYTGHRAIHGGKAARAWSLPVITNLGYEPGHLEVREKKLNNGGKGTYVNSYSLQLQHINLK